jgi:hypothetical protein
MRTCSAMQVTPRWRSSTLMIVDGDREAPGERDRLAHPESRRSHFRKVDERSSPRAQMSELGPPNENLLRHAGHTPMAIIDVDDSRRSTQEVIDQTERPLESGIVWHIRKVGDLIFGRLMNVRRLNELDQKLLDQAKNILGSGESADPNETDPESEFPPHH